MQILSDSDVSGLHPWRRSTFCSESTCVEVQCVGGRVQVRDSKRTDGAWLEFTAEEWEAFVAGVKNGEFDTAA